MASSTFGGFGNFGQPAASSASSFSFGAVPSTQASAFGAAPSTGFGFANTATTKPSAFGGGGFFSNPTTTASSFGFPTTTSSNLFGLPSTGTTTATGFTSSLGALAPAAATVYQFPKKTQDQSTTTSGPSQTVTTTTVVKAGFSGTKPKDHIIDDFLKSEVSELEKRIRKFLDIQKAADAYSLQDAVDWETEIKDFTAMGSKIEKKLSETYNLIDALRKNAAHLHSNTLLSSRLTSNPAAYYSIAAAVESYFMEVISGLRTEMEILEDELSHLENLHEDLLRSGNERYHPRDLQATYAYLSKIVGGIAVAVDEMIKVGQDLRKEVQITKGGGGPGAVPQQTFMAQDVAQLSAARSLFSAPTVAAATTPKNLSNLSKSPLLQQVNTDQQFTMFNPAMRSLMRLDSVSSPTKSATHGSTTSSASGRMGGFGLFSGTTSPGF